MKNGADWVPFDGNLGRGVMWRLDMLPQTGCTMVQAFVIDFSRPTTAYAGTTFLANFYGRIVDLLFSDGNMRISIATSPTKGALGTLGSSENRIPSYSFDGTLKCDAGTLTWSGNSAAGMNSITNAHTAWGAHSITAQGGS